MRSGCDTRQYYREGLRSENRFSGFPVYQDLGGWLRENRDKRIGGLFIVSMNGAIPKLDDKTLGLISSLLPDFDPVIQVVESSLGGGKSFGRLDLPLARDADYFFEVWLYGDMERQISARLTQDVSDNSKYFWYRPFDELVEQPGSREDLISSFCDVLKTLLTFRTRIVQRKGWLFWHFRCEYCEADTWRAVYCHSAFRGGKFKAPQISGSKRVYQSDAIALGNAK